MIRYKKGDVLVLKSEYNEDKPSMVGMRLTVKAADRDYVYFEEKAGGYYHHRFLPASDSTSKVRPAKAEFSVRYAREPKYQQRHADRVFKRMQQKMPKWLLDGLLVAMLEEAKTRVPK